MTSPDTVTALRQQLADLQELVGWLDDDQQRQRDVLAAEVHDQLGSSLTALTMRLALIERHTRASGDPRLPEQWVRSNVLLGGITQTARRIQHQLRPIALESLGLQAMLADYLDEFGKRTGIVCALAVSGAEPDLSLATLRGLLRLLQEALANIERHAGPCQIDVTLNNDGRQCRLTIDDNGCGFDLAGLDWRRSHGLRLMRARAARLPARLDLHSAPQQGCRISVVLALST
ncbi:histidine kinase [Actimicrobium sp. CCC2.4]|uniref:sensor histidine kinase n=1 Tax=Actimicrobium sp. CCC2.4 TaxID=3048606 RepID=UPI002AC9D2BB|nr:ATP-binding protein [Actimicrobium sp. CCC2.4]MEB0134147.1 histidine kinase [Actimicrobium sp. CCC2.4]WPX32802.1 histidine kinase [Actimicrobium sp. CCC2.4]